jgi:uncharacterized membrane protein HdeD (DUF308 family)
MATNPSVSVHGRAIGLAVVDLETLTRNWWAVLLRGLVGILFGIVTLVSPGISLAALVLLFGAYALADGVLLIVSAIRRHNTNERPGVLALEGILGVIAGVATFLWPGITALALLFLIAAWAVVTGIVEIVAAIRLRRAISGEWLLALGGLASVGLGVLLFLFPSAGALGVVLWIGAYAMVSGALLVALAFRLRGLRRTHGHPRQAAFGLA